MRKLGFIFMGLVGVFMGEEIIRHPIYYEPRFGKCIDFKGYNIPIGSIILTGGILNVLVALRRKESDYREKFFICPKCEKAYRKRQTPHMCCPLCKIKVKELKGYYKKEQTLRNGDKKKLRVVCYAVTTTKKDEGLSVLVF